MLRTHKFLVGITGHLVLSTVCLAQTTQPSGFDYLSDVVCGISQYTLEYTRIIGLDTTTYPLWPKVLPGAPLKIKGKAYAKGVGAPPGPMTIMLDGQYEAFEAEVGLQEGNPGSCVFTISVDGKPVFNSGPITHDQPAHPVRVSLAGANEMSLVAGGSGDPIWADARLIRSQNVPPIEPVDMARFARVCTWDPARINGTQASRVDEMPAADVFTETNLAPDADGLYAIPLHAKGTGCIGLQWYERRRFRELALQFADTASTPPADAVRVECWTPRDSTRLLDGHSEWQGKWTPVNGAIERRENKLTLRIEARTNREIAEGAYKIRWLLPSLGKSAKVRSLQAVTTSKWETATLCFQMEKTQTGSAELECYNGFLADPSAGERGTRYTWNMVEPARLPIVYTRPRPWGFDRTVVRVRLPGWQFAVAVDDVLAQGCVYVAHAGLFVTADPSRWTLEKYKASIADQQTIPTRVRQMPEQTLSEAMKALNTPTHDRSPTMLSLACDNRKIILERSGNVGFGPLYTDGPVYRNRHRMSVILGTGAGHDFPESGAGTKQGYHRELEDGWLPISHITVVEGDLKYSQVTYVAPFDQSSAPPGGPWWFNSKPLAVVEHAIENPARNERQAKITLAFLADRQANRAAELRSIGNRIHVMDADRLLAIVDTQASAPLHAEIQNGQLTVSGSVPATGTLQFATYIPLEWQIHPQDIGSSSAANELHQRTQAYWRKMLAPAARMVLPDALLTNLIAASQVHCMLAARSEDNGQTIDPWIASAYYCSLDTESHAIIHGMDLMGQHDFARRGFEFFLKRHKPAGYLSHGYTLMGTGQHLWYGTDHYRLTGDRAWLEQIAPKIVSLCRWTLQQCANTRRQQPDGGRVPEWGMVPPSVAADWPDFGYIFSVESYFYAGLVHGAQALRDIGQPQAEEFTKAAVDLRRDILRAFQATQAQSPVVPRGDGTWIPYYPLRLFKPGPSEQFFPNYLAARLYDVELGSHQMVNTGVLDARDPCVEWMIDHMEDTSFLRESAGSGYFPADVTRADWFNRAGFPHDQPYYAHYVELLAARDEVKLLLRSFFNQLATSINREDLTFWENPWTSVWNKTHETGRFLQQARLLLVMERDRDLWLGPFLPAEWLQEGKVVQVENAPTLFGNVSYRIESHVSQGYIHATLTLPARNARPQAAQAVILRLRHPEGIPMQRVLVDHRPLADFHPKSESIRIAPEPARVVDVRVEYEKR